jgi:release factor glutamine methyltransferase
MDTVELVTRLRAAGCVFAEEEAQLLQETATDEEHLGAMVGRRVSGEPLEYVLGWAEFAGLRIEVDPGVFRPRPRTEFLVEHAAWLIQGAPTPAAPTPGAPTPGAPTPSAPTPGAPTPSAPTPDASASALNQWTDGITTEDAGRSDRRAVVVVDLCCGTGAIGLAVATRVALVELHASDVAAAAVACARRNVERVGGRVYQGDLFRALPDRLRGQVDMLLANVPYVPTGDLALMPAEARLHEPVGTLDGGPDGLDVLRRVAVEAPRWLAPGGWLLSEVSVGQAQEAAEVLRSAGLEPAVEMSEEHDATLVVGRR